MSIIRYYDLEVEIDIEWCTPINSVTSTAEMTGDNNSLSDNTLPVSDAGLMASANLKSRRRTERIGDLPTLCRNVYEFNDLTAYPLRDRITIRIAERFLFALVWTVCRTARFDVLGMENLESVMRGGHRAIYTFWHSCIFSATWFWRRRGIVVMSSRSRDGEYTGRMIKRFGYGTARGSSTRGASRALVEMAMCLDNGIDVAFTIDGPRGPAGVAKTGAITLARHTGHGVLPFHVSPRRFIQLRSWDRMKIPLPFTRLRVTIGTPIFVPKDASDDQVELKQRELQKSLEHLQVLCEAWD